MRALLLGLTLGLLVPTALTVPATASVSGGDSLGTERAVPKLRVTKMISGLDHPWDVVPIGRGRVLFTQRDRATLTMWKGGHKHPVTFPSGPVWVSGETGLMGLEVDPDFKDNGRIYTCQGNHTGGGGHDIRVIAWRLNDAATKATHVKKLVGGFPTTSGRHGGCRLLITRNGSMLVGTGDAAHGTNPEDLTSLGGKTLRLNRMTGAPWPTNPFINSDNHNKRYVHTFGHRNVQGVTERSDGSLWNIEQGTYRDDEVNKLVNGGDYGYNPVPGYNETVPMTDQSLPGTQIDARWSSGDPTLACSGGTFLYGDQWGALNGSLAVAVQKSTRVLFLSFDEAGNLTKVHTPANLRRYGRIRTVVQAPNGDLWIPTDNGGGTDSILRVRPIGG